MSAIRSLSGLLSVEQWFGKGDRRWLGEYRLR